MDIPGVIHRAVDPDNVNKRPQRDLIGVTNGPLSGFGLVFPAYFTTKYWGKASQDFCFLKMTYVH